MKTLVAFYSRTGVTREAAGELAGILKGDTEEIMPEKVYSGIVGFLRGGREAKSGKHVVIRPSVKDPAGYDMVIIGSPVWVGTMATPVRAYIEAHRARLRKVAFFCTMGGQEGQVIFRDMEAAAGKKPEATLWLRKASVRDGSFRELLRGFAKKL